MSIIQYVTFPYRTSKGTIIHLPMVLPNQAPLFDDPGGANPVAQTNQTCNEIGNGEVVAA